MNEDLAFVFKDPKNPLLCTLLAHINGTVYMASPKRGLYVLFLTLMYGSNGQGKATWGDSSLTYASGHQSRPFVILRDIMRDGCRLNVYRFRFPAMRVQHKS